MNSNSKKVRILNSYINPTTFKFLQSKIINWVKEKKGHYICISNVHQTIEAYNHKEFAESIIYLLKNKDKRDEFGLNGFNLVQELCNSKTMSKKTLELYEKVINR